MPSIERKARYGLSTQLTDRSLQLLVYIVPVYVLLYVLGVRLVDYFAPAEANPMFNHRLKDAVALAVIAPCFALYLYYIVRFIKTKLAYVDYLVSCVRLIKSGDYGQELRIRGNDELAYLAAHIDELREETIKNHQENEQRRAAQAALLSSISHDLRTPLTSVVGYLEILSDEDFSEPDKVKSYTLLCLNRARQLQRLLNAAFEHFYLTVKEYEKSEQLRCDSIKKLFAIALDRVQLLQQNGFAYDVDFPDYKYALVYNTSLLSRLFDNVFGNVVRYAKLDAPVSISAKMQKRRLVIKVENEARKDIYAGGTGLGINNCKRIMLLHKGEFRSYAENGRFVAAISFPIQKNYD